MRVDARHLVPYQSDTVAGRLLLLAKDERLPMLTDFFADELVSILLQLTADRSKQNTVITYLPRGRCRARISGVDQGRVLAKALAKRLNVAFLNIFDRRNSAAQKENNTAEQRLRSARRSYRLKKRLPNLSEKTVILVDDIFTSGATMIAGAELLRSVGVKEIHCISIGKRDNNF